MGYKKKEKKKSESRIEIRGLAVDVHLKSNWNLFFLSIYILCDVLQLSEKKMNKQWVNHSILKRNHSKSFLVEYDNLRQKRVLQRDAHSAHTEREKGEEKSIKIRNWRARNNKIQQP